MPLTALEQAELEVLTRLETDEAERVKCVGPGGLMNFIRLMWPVVEPTHPLVEGWVLEAICEHLEAVTFGQIRRLLMNVPPGPGWIENRVATSRGLLRLGDVVIGDEVLTHRGRYRPVLNVLDQGQRPLLKITTWSGRVTWPTADHPYMTPHGWKRADELAVGDVLAVPVPQSDDLPMLVTAEEARFLGYIVGDGGVSHSPLFHNTEEEILSDFEKCAATLGLLTQRRTRHAPSHARRNARWTHIGIRGALPLLKKHNLMGKNSYTKRIPSLVLGSGNDAIRNFLGAYWSCDGMIEVRKNPIGRSSIRSSCATVSEGLAKDLLHALSRLGINARIRRRERANPTKTRQIGERYVYYHVTIERESDTALLADMPIVTRKREQAALCRRSFRPTLIEDEIIAIEPAPPGQCRCVEVEEDHTWTWDGVVVSNSTKSLTTDVFWPAWEWGPMNMPSNRYMCASYSGHLTQRDNIRFRRLITSDVYVRIWGDRFGPADQFSVVLVANDKTGWKLSTSVGGVGTGERADRVIIDDGNNPLESESGPVLETTSLWFREVIPDRLNDQDRSAIVNIQQRTSEGDISGIIISEQLPYVHLCIPMEYDPTRHCVTMLGWEDPRGLDEDGYPLSEGARWARAGELAWPARFSPGAVAELKTVKGPYAYAGQYQQAPAPRGGGLFKQDWIEGWPSLNADGSYPQDMIRNGRIQYPALEYVVGWVDTAFTENQENDFSAMVVVGVFRAEGKGRIEPRGDGTFIRVADDYGFPKALVLHAWAKRLEIHGPPEEIPSGVTREQWASARYLDQRRAKWGLTEWVADTVKRYRVDYLGIETQAAGHTLEQELRRLHRDLQCSVELIQARGDKVARGYAVQPSFSSRQIYFPTYEDGTYPTWLEPLANQLFVFPRGQHDDLVDALTGAIKHLRDASIFELRQEFDRGEERAMTWPGANKRITLPYDLLIAATLIPTFAHWLFA